jgi:hypothetical protein
MRNIIHQNDPRRGGVFEFDDVQTGQILAEAIAVAAGIDAGQAADEKAVGGGVADDQHRFAGMIADNLREFLFDFLVDLPFPMPVIDFAQRGQANGRQMMRSADRFGCCHRAFHVAAKGSIDRMAGEAFCQRRRLLPPGIGEFGIARAGETIGIAGSGSAVANQIDACGRRSHRLIVTKGALLGRLLRRIRIVRRLAFFEGLGIIDEVRFLGRIR